MPDSDIDKIRQLLQYKGRDYISELLSQSKSRIQASSSYGSRLNSILSTFEIYSSIENTEKLRKLSKEEQNLIFKAIREVYPVKDSAPEISEVKYYFNSILKESEKESMQYKGEPFIKTNFTAHQLPVFDKYKSYINQCERNSNLYRLVPLLLRNLFENLLYHIFFHGLYREHHEYIYTKHHSRPKNLSELIAFLDILKYDIEFRKIHVNTITQNTITYLKNIRKKGNETIHIIVDQLKRKQLNDLKEDVELTLDALLHLHTNLKGQNFKITQEITIDKLANKFGKKQEKISKIPKLIESIKNMGKDEMTFLITSLSFDDLYPLIENIMTRIVLTENYEEYEANINLVLFIKYNFNLITEEDEIISLLGVIFPKLRQLSKYALEDFIEIINNTLNGEKVIDWVLNNDYIDDLIEIFVNSSNFRVAKLNAYIIFKFKNYLKDDQVVKIANGVIDNFQIYKPEESRKIATSILKKHKHALSEVIIEDLFKIGINLEGMF